MIEDYAISELARRLGNVVRAGVISAVDGRMVKIKDGSIETGFMPIMSTAGDTTAWIPPTVGEHILYLCPFGELSQGVVLRSIHYDDFDKPTEKETENIMQFKDGTKITYDHEENKMNLSSDKAEFKAVLKESILELLNDGINLKFGENIEIVLSKDELKLRAFDSEISMGRNSMFLDSGKNSIELDANGINLHTGDSEISVSEDSIWIDSNNVRIYPPVCKCGGV